MMEMIEYLETFLKEINDYFQKLPSGSESPSQRKFPEYKPSTNANLLSSIVNYLSNMNLYFHSRISFTTFSCLPKVPF